MSGFALKTDETYQPLIFSKPGVPHLARHLYPVFEAHFRRFDSGGYLIFEGDACKTIYLVLEGWLSVSKSLEDGQTQIIDFTFPGETIAPLSADGTTSAVTVQALQDGAVLAIPKTAWDGLLQEQPDLQSFVLAMDAAKRARRAERMLRLGKGTAEMRVAYALLEFGVRLRGDCETDSMSFHIPITQQQLGDFIGLSSVHVCRTMRRMTRNGLIKMSGHMDIRLLDIPGIAALAGIDCAMLRREIVPQAS